MYIFDIYGIIMLGDTMDDKLLEILNNNSNLDDSQKIKINNYLQAVKLFYGKYGVEYNFENISDILRTLKIVEGTDKEEISYNNEQNVIILGKSPKNVEFNSVKCLLEFCSQKYDKETGKYNSGILIKKDDKEYGKEVNKCLTNFLTTMATDLCREEDEELTIEEMLKDRRPDVLHMIQEFVSAEKLVEYYSNADGQGLFNELSKNIDPNQLFSLYKLLDDIEEAKRLQEIEDREETIKM